MKVCEWRQAYFEKVFTNHKIKYSPRPAPKANTDTTNAILTFDVFHPNFLLTHPATPKIIVRVFVICDLNIYIFGHRIGVNLSWPVILL